MPEQKLNAPWTPLRRWQSEPGDTPQSVLGAEGEEIAEYMAEPYTKVIDCKGNYIVTCHDLADISREHGGLIALIPVMLAEIERLAEDVENNIADGDDDGYIGQCTAKPARDLLEQVEKLASGETVEPDCIPANAVLNFTYMGTVYQVNRDGQFTLDDC